MRTARLLILRAGYLVGGALLCLASLVAYRNAWRLSEVELPWGLVLALAATYLGVRACALLDRTPAGAMCCAVGWAGVLTYLYGGRAEGDYLIAADWRGYVMLIGGLVAAGAGVLVSMGGPQADPDRPRPSIS